jgi:hypothetical protein
MKSLRIVFLSTTSLLLALCSTRAKAEWVDEYGKKFPTVTDACAFNLKKMQETFKGAKITLTMKPPFALTQGLPWPAPTCFFILSNTKTAVIMEVGISPSCNAGFKPDRNALSGCIPIDFPGPHPIVGDIVIYRYRGVITHSGVISQVAEAINPKEWVILKIVSKWGAFWGVYEHDPNDVPFDYGDWTVYHTSRGSNVLKTFAAVFWVTDTYSPPASTNHVVANQFDSWFHVLKNTVLTPDQALGIIGGLEWWGNPTGIPASQGGLPLSSKLKPVRDPSLAYDCHGYTFADGAVTINSLSIIKGVVTPNVQYILMDNQYAPLSAKDTRGKLHPAP